MFQIWFLVSQALDPIVQIESSSLLALCNREAANPHLGQQQLNRNPDPVEARTEVAPVELESGSDFGGHFLGTTMWNQNNWRCRFKEPREIYWDQCVV